VVYVLVGVLALVLGILLLRLFSSGDPARLAQTTAALAALLGASIPAAALAIGFLERSPSSCRSASAAAVRCGTACSATASADRRAPRAFRP
jgi:hypothetical protein